MASLAPRKQPPPRNSTIYLLIIGSFAVAGIPSAGSDPLPPKWRRDV